MAPNLANTATNAGHIVQAVTLTFKAWVKTLTINPAKKIIVITIVKRQSGVAARFAYEHVFGVFQSLKIAF